MLECYYALGLFHIQFNTLLAPLELRGLNLVETLQCLIYISEETSSENNQVCPMGLGKKEKRSSGLVGSAMGGSRQKEGSAAERRMEELRQRMDQQPES